MLLEGPIEDEILLSSFLRYVDMFEMNAIQSITDGASEVDEETLI